LTTPRGRLVIGTMLDAVVERFVKHSPITVMARLALERVLEPSWMDELFEEHRRRQYQRELLFSTVVDIVALVALGLRPSIHAAARTRESLGVSLTALYDKINHTEPALGRALVQQGARRLAPLVTQFREGQAPLCPGYRIRIVDGNCLAPSEKRLKPLRKVRSAALPGRSLVVYDPDLCLVTDVLPSEDGHAGERALMAELMPTAQPGELWMGDRLFCTYAIMSNWGQRGCAFVVREHSSNAKLTFCDSPQERGKTETGALFEHLVDCHGPDGNSIRLRRIELHLHKPTEDGDTVLSILTNLPEQVTAAQIADLYRRRWTIESMFQKLEKVLASEIETLGYPRAALFSFCVALLGYNVLSMVQAAVESEHRIEPRSTGALSLYYVADEVKMTYAGMMIAVPAEKWTPLRQLDLDDLGKLLLRIAANVRTAAFRKSVRGPKKTVKKERVPPSVAGAHVSTARILDKPRRSP
jgi:IS4 transposase